MSPVPLDLSGQHPFGLVVSSEHLGVAVCMPVSDGRNCMGPHLQSSKTGRGCFALHVGSQLLFPFQGPPPPQKKIL